MKEEQHSFFNNVLQVAALIPKGKITTYGAIAAYLSTPKSARMVGWALNSQKHKGTVPAHRVVNRTGHLTGKLHFSTPNEMELLLNSEGIETSKGQIVQMERYFWDPAVALKMD